jgi:phospholipid/cholesterol/gamma-HCH transport system ATP-binding protein
VIDLVDICVRYNDFKALDNLSLHVDRGELLGILGPGGCGKSTVCKVVAGLIKPQQGDVVVDNINIMQASQQQIAELQKHIGIQFQNDALFEHMTVVENIGYPLKRLTSETEHNIYKKAAHQLAMVGLAGFENNMPGRLSGGQRRRVALARACITNPPLLICDDPTAGLDPVTSRQILDMIAGIRVETGGTVIIVSSDVPGLLSVSTRIALVWEGKVIEENSVQAFKSSNKKEVRRFLNDAALPFKNWSWG